MARRRTTSRGNDALLDATAATAPKMAVKWCGTVSSFVICATQNPDYACISPADPTRHV